jgi:hypothetical protein
MKIFCDEFTIFNDLLTHLEKLKKLFLKCRKFGINFILDKCAFMVFSGTILGFIISKKGKIMDPKKIEALINMLVPTTPQQIHVFNGMAQFYRCFIKKIASTMSPITNSRSLKFLNGPQNVRLFRRRLRTDIYKPLS